KSTLLSALSIATARIHSENWPPVERHHPSDVFGCHFRSLPQIFGAPFPDILANSSKTMASSSNGGKAARSRARGDPGAALQPAEGRSLYALDSPSSASILVTSVHQRLPPFSRRWRSTSTWPRRRRIRPSALHSSLI